MRRKDESKKPIISDFINAFYYEHDKVPSVREIVEGTGIPLSTVHRYLVDMQEKGELSYNGYRSARTKEMSEVSPIHGIGILERQEYTGCTVNFKTYTNSIWDKKQRENPDENRAVFYNTHPTIIEPEVFDKVQEIRQQRHRRTKTGKSHVFSGLVFCADCKAKMRYCTTRYFEERQDHFVCANYRSNTGTCSAHFIRAVVLEQLVWKHMQMVIDYVLRYEVFFRAKMEQRLRIESSEILRVKRKQLDKAEKRILELDKLFVRIYEDNVAGKLSDERFAVMSSSYEEEQQALKADAETLRQEIEVQEQQNQNLELFIQKVHQYADLDKLTAYAAHDLIKAIYIGAPDKSSGKRRQSISICYDFVGFIPLDELMKQETA